MAVSVVVPAHNEAAVIGRLLTGLLAGAQPGELDVVVAANGCDDDTAAIAASFGPAVRVVELTAASKAAALNAGDAAAHGFPRLYVDADVELGVAAVRAVAAALQAGAAVAAPRLRLELEDRPRSVRAYYSVWARLPYAQRDLVGVGVYGLSAEARGRFEAFPDTMADDLFVRGLAGPAERRAVEGVWFTQHPPASLASLVRVRARICGANRSSRRAGLAPARDGRVAYARTLLALAARPRWWPALAVYAAVGGAARAAARRGGAERWVRDETARLAAAAAP
ncbi:MAG: glycosyltransferase [Acidimicrobiales bacterium]